VKRTGQCCTGKKTKAKNQVGRGGDFRTQEQLELGDKCREKSWRLLDIVGWEKKIAKSGNTGD